MLNSHTKTANVTLAQPLRRRVTETVTRTDEQLLRWKHEKLNQKMCRNKTSIHCSWSSSTTHPHREEPEAAARTIAAATARKSDSSPRTPESACADSRLRKVASTSTWKPLWSTEDGSASACSPLCTHSDNSILQKDSTHVTDQLMLRVWRTSAGAERRWRAPRVKRERGWKCVLICGDTERTEGEQRPGLCPHRHACSRGALSTVFHLD